MYAHRSRRCKSPLTVRLVLIDDDFIERLLQLIEGLSDDVNDPYHYPVIRVLVRDQTGVVGGAKFPTS